MQIHPTRVWAERIACIFCFLCAAPAGAQTAGTAGPNENVPVLTKEKLFEGTGLTAESQNRVLGNLLRHYQSSQMQGAAGGRMEMRIFEAPTTNMMLVPKMAVPAPTWSPAPDACASQADETQLNAMHRLLEATLRGKSMDAMAFADKVPKGCNGQRLRYYLNVTAQLFPEGTKK